ncbi:MAG: methyltransferase domain-containing protein [Proteobacteria bacterium]|nr:methyltransferase domain-containing protein [Pseudomonadota bacterium]
MSLDEYHTLRSDAAGEGLSERPVTYANLVNQFYELVTDFYEYGWGRSFHFAPRKQGESFPESIARHEHYLADALRLGRESRVLDAGCGVGGPLLEIAGHTGAAIVGLNNSAYQIQKGERYLRRAGLADRCSFLRGDFMDIPAPAATFDAAYAIESTCHAPDRVAVFREIQRLLRPGGEFVGYEWCVTDRFDAGNAGHRQIVADIEEGNALPPILSTGAVLESLQKAGFDIVRSEDRAHDSAPETPWYHSLSGNDGSLRGLPRTPLGRKVTRAATRALEAVRLAPRGTTDVSDFLNRAADALVAGGETGIFTPMFFFHARKPDA